MFLSEPGLYVYGLRGFRLEDTLIEGDEPEVRRSDPKNFVICNRRMNLHLSSPSMENITKSRSAAG